MTPPLTTTRARTLVRHIGQLVSLAQTPLPGAYGPLQVLNNAAILATTEGKICWIGHDQEVDAHLARSHQEQLTVIDAHHRVVTPGFVDSHTHLVFAGDRSEEFHQRRKGISYGELLRQGRGILTTMNATRHASTAMLSDLARKRLTSMRAHGTTTVEIKTGYGLNLEAEERCLHIINTLNQSPSLPHQQIRVIPTFLGAHSVPPEYRERRAAYVDLVIKDMLPAFAGLARFCDVYCEREAFSLEECRRILLHARDLGYQLKVHADQLSPSGGSRLAAELGAISADHLDYASDADLDAMRKAGVVATLLPGCSYTLRTPYPSARRLLDHGLTVALATDYNPGTSYSENMQMMLGLAMSAMGMSLEEALTAATINGARALALQNQTGSIELGKHCDLALWSIHNYHDIGYHFGTNLIHSTLAL